MPRQRTNPAPYPCTACDERFTRLEHLRRHAVSIHSSGDRPKPFGCQSCGKRFWRRDILLRHQQAYEAADEAHMSASNNPQATRRACQNCNDLKLKCTGGPTCERCTSLGRSCKYALDRRQKLIKKRANAVGEGAFPSHSTESTASGPILTLDSTSDRAYQKNIAGLYHGLPLLDAGSPNQRSKRGRYVSHACTFCQKRKVKCSGENPCFNCRQAEAQCVYSFKKRRQRIEHVRNPSEIPEKADTPPPSATNAPSNETDLAEHMRKMLNRVSALENEYSGLKDQIISCSEAEESGWSSGDDTDNSSSYSRPGTISVFNDKQFHGATFVFAPLNLMNATVAFGDHRSNSSMHRDSSPQVNRMFALKLPTYHHRTIRYLERETRLYDVTILIRSFELYFASLNHHCPFLNENEVRTQFDCFIHDPDDFPDRPKFLAMINLVFAVVKFLNDYCAGSDGVPALDEFCRAQSILDRLAWPGNANLLTVQCLLLKTLYLLYIENMDAACDTMSQIVRLCFRLRLHDQSAWINCTPFEIVMRQRIFWTVYFLERHISFNTGTPYLLRESEFDVDIPANVEDRLMFPDKPLPVENPQRSASPYLRCTVKWGRLCAEIWDMKFAKKAPNSTLNAEFIALTDARILYVISAFPAHLRWQPSDVGLNCAPNLPAYIIRQRIVLFLLMNQLRLLLRQESILNRGYNQTVADDCVGIATGSIEALYVYHKQNVERRISRFSAVFWSISPILHLACIILHTENPRPTRGRAIEAFKKGISILLDMCPTFTLARHTMLRLDNIITKTELAIQEFSSIDASQARTSQDLSPPQLQSLRNFQSMEAWSWDDEMCLNGSGLDEVNTGFWEGNTVVDAILRETQNKDTPSSINDDLRKLFELSATQGT
ncbi:uncharacterized protein BDZ99DRAFT_576350 [Mytilinidion resinicola]|uniref:Zn(2)-C6 fungal-type domain-containing protein n=1 Tax=Mytilinidion resinicola TaxID=574789 RepID=A0A6A6Y4D0_9PEZI|nr:uncharacterized protein BDZ99DRAFT_576350 [Mytilinidion resinicola]KAF2803085.1 hypothetical protein BDZ99DRAFT_576350 [Mytilinidion resinicola]